MKGLICEGIETFRLHTELLEPVLVPGSAIISVRRIGICGTDFHAYKGNQPYFTYPRILGHELAGIIEKIGENEYGMKVGDQVSIIPYMHCGKCLACRRGSTNCCTKMSVLGVHMDGGMREKISVPIPHLIRTNSLTLDESAIIEPLAIGAHAVRRSEISAMDTVLVIGSGPIGLAVMAFAKYAGANVIAMDINQERLDFCSSWAKVNHTINAKETDVKRRLTELTDGDFPGVVFDATGNANSMTNAFELVGHGGRLIFVGLVKSDITFNDPDFHKRELTLMGSRNATLSDFNHVLNVLENSFIDIGSYITHRSSFDCMIEQFETWLKPESKVIKAVVEL